jgi:hypothetical protein
MLDGIIGHGFFYVHNLFIFLMGSALRGFGLESVLTMPFSL